MVESRARVVAVCEPMMDQGEMVCWALERMQQGLKLSSFPCDTFDPHDVGKRLAETGADLVLWDVSPVTAHACGVLEALLQARTLTACNVVVTTTDRARLVRYLGAAAGGLRILQKPYGMEELVLCLEHLARLGGSHVTAA